MEAAFHLSTFCQRIRCPPETRTPTTTSKKTTKAKTTESAQTTTTRTGTTKKDVKSDKMETTHAGRKQKVGETKRTCVCGSHVSRIHWGKRVSGCVHVLYRYTRILPTSAEKEPRFQLTTDATKGGERPGAPSQDAMGSKENVYPNSSTTTRTTRGQPSASLEGRNDPIQNAMRMQVHTTTQTPINIRDEEESLQHGTLKAPLAARAHRPSWAKGVDHDLQVTKPA